MANVSIADSNALDVAVFKRLMADMPQAVTIITAMTEDGTPVGATLSAVMSLSMNPPMMVAAFDRGSETLACLSQGRPFLIHILGEGQEKLAYRFAGKGGAAKFYEIEWSAAPCGSPKLPSAAGVIACRVVHLHEGGDHVLVTGSISDIEHPAEAEPLVYHRRELRPARNLRAAA
ncbi:flavin reductase family protein [Hansschlegelia quercus]|uniref:Flavin reductase n=1 Tax=Hansschlegelia quercus TaxID=2528245 RepID=A0A4Q9GPH4_9HYPH|nr:flavin reductase family protein [Hansschlegelia quercus]TBN53487.1 flavin reductase [Hansschlegelia quercus]